MNICTSHECAFQQEVARSDMGRTRQNKAEPPGRGLGSSRKYKRGREISPLLSLKDNPSSQDSACERTMASLEARSAYTHHTLSMNSRYRLIEQYSPVFTHSTQT